MTGPFHVPTSIVRKVQLLHSPPGLRSVAFIITTCGAKCHLFLVLMANGVDHLFMYLLSICISSQETRLFIFHPFKCWDIIIQLLTFESSSRLLDIWFSYKYPTSFCGLSFRLLKAMFEVQKFILAESNFSCITCAFRVVSKILLSKGHEDLRPCFSLRVL